MDDMYPDDSPSEPSKPKDKPKEKDSNTELVSKSFLGMDEDETAEEGHICKVRVVKDYGDEVEIEYVKHDKKDKKHDKENHKEEMSADEELDSMESSSMMKG